MATMAKATWNGAVLAESDETIEIDGFTYFPPSAVRQEYLATSDKRTT